MIDLALEKFKAGCHHTDAARFLNSNDFVLLSSYECAALGIEFFFKSIYYLEYNKPFIIKNHYSHDIYKLYYALSQNTRYNLKNKYNS